MKTRRRSIKAPLRFTMATIAVVFLMTLVSATFHPSLLFDWSEVRQEIKDSLCFLRWLHNGRDREAMVRAMTTPKRGIGDKAIEEFDEYCALVEAHFAAKPGGTVPSPLDVLISLSEQSAEDTFPPTAGTFSNNGASRMDAKNNTAMVIAVMPVRPPSLIPAADST